MNFHRLVRGLVPLTAGLYIGCQAPDRLALSDNCTERPTDLPSVNVGDNRTDQWQGTKEGVGFQLSYATEPSPETGAYGDWVQYWGEIRGEDLGCTQYGLDETVMCLREIERAVYCPDDGMVEVQIDLTLQKGKHRFNLRFDGSSDDLDLSSIRGELWVLDHEVYGDHLIVGELVMTRVYE
ncbi:hypothetical protein HON52_01640 [Candidatus Uhrbacteria bacterium]|jgi:hypothetical protein|nr:hypothetical protein [Candidatus Uhrbacteria bacterium]